MRVCNYELRITDYELPARGVVPGAGGYNPRFFIGGFLGTNR